MSSCKASGSLPDEISEVGDEVALVEKALLRGEIRPLHALLLPLHEAFQDPPESDHARRLLGREARILHEDAMEMAAADAEILGELLH